ncbi:MAG: alpha/beta hydrolase [Liquorilactobacillus sp.]
MHDKLFKTDLGDYKISVRAGKTIIVFLNGASGFDTFDSFAPIITKLPKSIGILAIDYLNSGMSSLTKKTYRLEEDITNLVEIIEKQNAQKIIIVAHSMGGILALPIADRINNFSGFIGLEPTTREIIFNPSKEKTYIAQKNKFEIMTEEQRIIKMQNQTKKNFSKEQDKLLWQHYYQNDQRHSEVKDAQKQKELIQSVVNYDNIRFHRAAPSVIFTQKYRKAEYERSEYITDRTKIICLGNNHYFFWDFPEEIAKKIIRLS